MQILYQLTDLPGVYQASLQLDTQGFVTKLHAESKWLGQGAYGAWQVDSLYEHDTEDQDLRAVLSWFRGSEVKMQLINLAVTDPVFCDQWSYPVPESLDQLVHAYSYFVRTPAHFIDHPWHVDARNLLLQGMIYIVDQSHSQQGTWFCRDYRVLNDADSCEILKLPAEPAQGWIMVNSDRSFHRGLNYASDDRFCIKFGLQFNLDSRNR